MADETGVKNQVVSPDSSNQPLTIEYVPRHFRMHNVSEAELEALASGTSSVHLTFFGICFGAAVSFGIVLFNGGLDPTHKLVYESFIFLSGLLGAYFGVRGINDYRQSKSKLKKLKGEAPSV